MLSQAANAAIGVLISLIASAIDAVGLNLQRRDHLVNQSQPQHLQKPEYRRPTWFLGFFLYVGSQLFGSTGALYFLQPAVVACLGAAALIFNFLFAAWLVKTVIHRMDVFGTSLIIAGAVLVATFGTIEKTEVSIYYLIELYNRPVFIAYFSSLLVVAILILVVAHSKFKVLQQLRPAKMPKLVGFCYAVSGGMIASVTVQLAETGIRLLVVTFGGDNQFYDATAYVIVVLLVASAILQVICMNLGLRVCDSVIVVPVFFAFYSVLSLINQNVYYDLWGHYGTVNYALIIPAIFLLIYGVYIITASHAVGVQSALNDEEDSEQETRSCDSSPIVSLQDSELINPVPGNKNWHDVDVVVIPTSIKF